MKLITKIETVEDAIRAERILEALENRKQKTTQCILATSKKKVEGLKSSTEKIEGMLKIFYDSLNISA